MAGYAGDWRRIGLVRSKEEDEVAHGAAPWLGLGGSGAHRYNIHHLTCAAFPTDNRPDRPIPYTFGSCKLATLPVSKLGRLSYRVISKACFAIYSSSDTTSRPRCRTCHRILPRAHSHSHSFSLAVLMYRCSVKRNETS